MQQRELGAADAELQQRASDAEELYDDIGLDSRCPLECHLACHMFGTSLRKNANDIFSEDNDAVLTIIFTLPFRYYTAYITILTVNSLIVITVVYNSNNS